MSERRPRVCVGQRVRVTLVADGVLDQWGTIVRLEPLALGPGWEGLVIPDVPVIQLDAGPEVWGPACWWTPL